MAKKEELENEQMQSAAGAEGDVEQPRPNRDRYKAMLAEDYPDLDFEDKETRYGKMAEDRERYNEYRKSGRALSETFDQNRWLAAMLQDLRENPDLDPITWMADNGIDINEAMQDEEYAKKVSEKIAAFQKRQVDGEQAAQERADNLQVSAEALQGLQEEYGLSDDDALGLWNDFFQNVIDPAMRGEISEDTWRMVIKARNYDGDVKTAREEGAREAGNQKVMNKVRNKRPEGIPPTMSQGTGQKATAPRRQESLMDFVRNNQ